MYKVETTINHDCALRRQVLNGKQKKARLY